MLRSGYPLQTRVAEYLRRHDWYVQEEWGYVDGDTEILRALDVHADLRLYESIDQRVYPGLTLLVECKQSEMPYVFFDSLIKDEERIFPSVAGLRHETIEITDNVSQFPNYRFTIVDLLGVGRTDYIAAPPRCAAFSRCVRKGKTIELSGTDPYHALVLPLLKAAAFFARFHAPGETARYFHPRLVVPLAVLSAPMIRVAVGEPEPTFALAPWFRIYRHEAEPEPEYTAVTWRDKLSAIDAIHVDFLDTYIKRYLLPFAQTWAARATDSGAVIAEGIGCIPGLEELDTDDALVDALHPVPADYWEALLADEEDAAAPEGLSSDD